MFFRLKLYGVLGLIFLILILGFAAVRWLPILRFNTIQAFDDRGQSIAPTSFFILLFRDPVVRAFGEDSIILWLASALDFHPLLLPNVDTAIDWWERRLIVRPKPQIRTLIWCAIEHCFWMNEQGILFDVAPDVEGQLVRRVSVVSERSFALGVRAIPDALLRALVHVFDFLETGKISIARITLEEASFDLTVVSDDGLTLLFNLRSDVTTTLRSFADVKQSIDIARAQSIDFRVPQKIYYVPRA